MSGAIRRPSCKATTAGRFKIPNLLPGDLVLTLQANGLEPQTLDLAITNQMPELKVAMSPGHIFKGRVLDETGQPVAGASVQLDRVNLEPLEFDWSATTDSQGRFSWDSAPSGEHPYLITAEGYNLRSEPALLADDTEKTITLRKANGKTDVDGRVTDAASHAPIEKFSITVYLTTDQGTTHAEKEVSSPTGDYLVEVDPKVTSFMLEFHQPGYLPASTEVMSPGDGDQREDVQSGKRHSRAGGRAFDRSRLRRKNQLAGRADHRADRYGSRNPRCPILSDEAARQKWMSQFLKSARRQGLAAGPARLRRHGRSGRLLRLRGCAARQIPAPRAIARSARTGRRQARRLVHQHHCQYYVRRGGNSPPAMSPASIWASSPSSRPWPCASATPPRSSKP